VDLNAVLASPLLWFAALVLVGGAIYWWAGRIAPRGFPSPEKRKAYIGGEDVRPQVAPPGYNFYHVALFFTIMHVAALVVATAPPDRVAWGAVGYLGVVSMSVVLLRWN